MSVLDGIDGLTALTDVELDALLAQLETEEQLVSKRRGALHNRIDFVGGSASADAAGEQFASLHAAERELSERRHVLHRRIDEVRAERGRRRTRR